jgi:ribonucleoside-diphosphate reductase beta chain
MSLLDSREYYKPFHYGWAFDGYQLQKKIEWLPEEVPLLNDVKDWNLRLSPPERNLLTQIFRFFTQTDADIASGYYERFLPKFGHPEIRMMMGAFASMEATHMHAYSMLLDTVGMPESEYRAFHSYKEMRAKHEFMFRNRQNPDPIRNLAIDLAVFSAFGEGMQLFSSFAILQNFARYGKMQGMNSIITYSIRDESLHVEYMIKLFRALLDENPHLSGQNLYPEIAHIAQEMVELEDHFIDLAFEQGGIEGLSPEDVKLHIRHIADRRMEQLGYHPIYGQRVTPLSWIDHIVNGAEHVNFFEQRSTDYAKSSLSGDWGDIGF